MSQARLELDEATLARAERLAQQRGITMEQLLRWLIEEASKSSEGSKDPVLGCFSNEPELMDQVVETALHSRKTQPLRLPNG